MDARDDAEAKPGDGDKVDKNRDTGEHEADEDWLLFVKVFDGQKGSLKHIAQMHICAATPLGLSFFFGGGGCCCCCCCWGVLTLFSPPQRHVACMRPLGVHAQLI